MIDFDDPVVKKKIKAIARREGMTEEEAKKGILLFRSVWMSEAEEDLKDGEA